MGDENESIYSVESHGTHSKLVLNSNHRFGSRSKDTRTRKDVLTAMNTFYIDNKILDNSEENTTAL